MESQTIVLVGCGAKKNPTPCSAATMYQGALKKALAYAKQMHPNKIINILVLYHQGKVDEAIRKYFRDQVEPQLEASKTGHVYELFMQGIEQIRQNMEQLQKYVEEKHIDLVVAAQFNAFLALALPAEVKKLVICPIVDPLVDRKQNLAMRVLMDYSYMRSLRRMVCGYIPISRKRNTYAIFIRGQVGIGQQNIFVKKYGHKNISNWTDFVCLTPSRLICFPDQVAAYDYWRALEQNFAQIISTF